MKKISFIVIFAMVLSLLMQFSVTVSAAGGEGDATTINVNDTLVMPTNVNYNAGVFTINSNAVSPITVTGTGSNTIAVAGGVSGLTLILNDVSITSPSGGSSPINLQSNANVTIQLTDGTSNLLDANGANNVAGLCVPSTATVAINGTGSLTATGGRWGAGIGGGSGAAGGTININSGTVKATGGQRGAGIGGGNICAGGTVSITGGTVTAAGGDSAAGIGGSLSGAGGTVNISGGTVTATGGSGGAGIGGGSMSPNGATFNITGTPIIMAASDNSKPAIHADSGSGIVINAALNKTISTNPTYLKCNGNELTFPGNYKSFAFSAAADSAVNAYSDPAYTTLLGIIMTNPAGVTNIPVTSPAVVTPVMINTATITVKKDGSIWTAGTPTMQLSTSNTALQGAISGTCSNGVYTFAGIDPATTYYVWDTTSNQYTGQSVISTSVTVSYYSLTVNLNGGNGSSANGIYTSGSIVPIDAGTMSGYTFSGWTTSNGGTFANTSNASTTYTMPSNTATITANWKPVLTGSVNLTINQATGQVTASVSGGNIGTAGTLTYTWSGGATGTGTTATPTLGTPTTCTLTAAGASGSINASITVYKVTVTKSGNTGIDNVSIANAYGKAGDSISLAYTLDSTGTLSNALTYSGTASNPAAISTPGSGTSSYTIASGDAASGTIALTATFLHANTPTYALTINGGGTGASGYGSYTSGAAVSIDAGTKSGYTFSGWTTSGGGTFGTASSASTTFTMPSNAATITANWIPVLTGSVNLTINQATGQVTASASGGNTGTTGALTYTWSGGATGTGTTATPTLGMPTTCTLTAAGASGSINASITVYKVTVTKSGNTGTDNVSIANAYGKAGDSISLAYTLDSTGTLSNTLTYSGAASNPAAVSAPGSGTSSYTIASGDASSGIVALTATFSHLNIPTYALTIIGGGTGVSGAGSYTSGSVVPIDAGTKSGYIFSGWTTSGGGTFGTASSAATTFTMPASAATITANWTLSSSGGGSGGSGGGTPTLTPTHVPVIVDGKDYFIGDVAVEDNTATITVNQSEFDKQLAAAEQSVIVPVSSDAGTVVAQLVVKNVQDMNDKGVPLSIQTGNINYNIPASSIDTKAILTALGATDPSLAPVNLTIRINVDSATQAIVDAAISTTSVKEIIPAVQFEVSANYNGKTYDIVNFDNFVSRSVEITQEQAQQITTAIVINPDRTIRHVPTFVYQKDGKWYAQINSRTNSTYVLIYNQMSFSDADGKWYQPVVNEMGSRKIISGVSNNCFAGEKAITRAEFAAILVRALGLPASGTATFSDVSANAWYSGAVATAAQYGIVGGVGHNKFAPNDKITREQAMQMIYNASRLTPYAAVTGTDNTRSFTDYGTQSVWATDAVIFNINNGFIQGYNGLFNPKSNITRAETATVVLKLLQKSGLVDVRTKL